ncbi:MAG: DUF86 domain-containing protein [Chlorobium sp.]|nr:DUF86 domain-containing protein [Chlorobium sp.]
MPSGSAILKLNDYINPLVHDYLSIDLETVWAVVEFNLLELKKAVRAALR